jgi:hypothetical protein
MTQRDSHDDLLDLAIRESVGGRFASAVDAAASSAWSSSASRAYLLTVSAKWRALTPSARIRVLSLGGAVAVVVHRAMSLLGPPEPLGAVLPSVVLVACVVMAALAGPIAQAVERIRR